jgi:RsiW-degrading membrane proteinase PrsW (M82 family)
MLELLVLAIAPTLFILLYIYRKDRYEPEPLHLVAWIFFLGALSCIPAGLIEMLFPDGVFSSVVVAPVVEETLKFLVVFLAIYPRPEFDEPMDGIVYATAAGLGFAAIENILYVIEGGLAVGIVRAIVSVPGHVVFSCIWGFALGIAKFRPENERTGIIVTGLFGAMLLHGIFNFSLVVFGASGLLLILLVIIPLGWWMTCRNIGCAHADPASACSAINRSAALSEPAGATPAGMSPISSVNPPSPSVPALSSGAAADGSSHSAGNPTPRFCTNCGTPQKSGRRFCENCGKKF